MIDLLKLRAQAMELEALLRRYAPDNPDIEQCQRELEPLIRAIARADSHISEEPPVPCARFFGEGGFEPWPDLLNAYSSFYVTLKDLGGVEIPSEQ